MTEEALSQKSLSHYLIFLIFALLLLLFLSKTFPLLSFQEARRAVIIQGTYLSKTFIQSFNGEPYFTKPPLHTYLSLPFYALGKALHEEIFFLRLPSFLSYFLIFLLLYFIHRRDLLRTLITLFILLTSFRFLSFIYRIDLEPLFVCFVLLSVYFLMKYLEVGALRFSLGFYFAFALAFLVRGPLHFFLIPALFLYALIFKEKRLIKFLLYPPSLLLFLLLTLPWYLYGYLKFGPSVFQEFLGVDLSERLSSHKDPFYYYLKALFLNFLPYFLLLIIKIKPLKENFYTMFKPFPLRLCLFLTIVPLFLLSFTGSKFDKYLLHLYPLFSLALTEFLLRLYSAKILLKVSSIFFLLNFLAVIIFSLSPLEDLKLKEAIWERNLPKGKYLFFEEVQPLLVFKLKRPIPVINSETEIEKALKEKGIILSPREIPHLSPSLILPDPYKKGKFWYVYK